MTSSLPLLFLALALSSCAGPGGRPVVADVAVAHDARVATIVDSEIDRAIADWHPARAVVVVLDIPTGAIVATGGRDAGRADPAIASNHPYVTGSTIKTFTIAAALEAHTANPSTRFDCATRQYGADVLRDASPSGTLTHAEILSLSSNVGASRVLDATGLPSVLAEFRRVHIGDPPGEIPPVTDGASLQAGLLAAGEWARATPLQVAAAYAAVFDGGIYRAPTARAPRGAPEQALSEATARSLVAMLENTVSSERGRGRNARVPGLRVAGKTGTADLGDGRTYASFVRTVLDRQPRLVVLVALEAPQSDGNGSTAAAPVFARIAQRLWL